MTVMKIFFYLLNFFVFLTAENAQAGILDRSYSIIESNVENKFDVFNDGRNTYIEAVRGLVIRGATADGDRLIIDGVPSEIRAVFNGQEITIMRQREGNSLQQNHLHKFNQGSPERSGAQQTYERIDRISENVDRLAKLLPESALSKKTVDQENSSSLPTSGQTPESHGATPEVWEVKQGENVRDILEGWRARAGWEMVWDFDGGFIVQANAKFTGSFQFAVREFINALPKSVNFSVELASNKLVYVSKGKN
jgi:hypothetical protein